MILFFSNNKKIKKNNNNVILKGKKRIKIVKKLNPTRAVEIPGHPYIRARDWRSINCHYIRFDTAIKPTRIISTSKRCMGASYSQHIAPYVNIYRCIIVRCAWVWCIYAKLYTGENQSWVDSFQVNCDIENRSLLDEKKRREVRGRFRSLFSILHNRDGQWLESQSYIPRKNSLQFGSHTS